MKEMIILVRAMLAPEKPANYQYELVGRTFPLGTRTEEIADFVKTLVIDRLNCLEIRLCEKGEVEKMVPGIQDIVGEHRWKTMEGE